MRFSHFLIHKSLGNSFGKVIAICINPKHFMIIFSQSYHYSRNLQMFRPLKISGYTVLLSHPYYPYIIVISKFKHIIKYSNTVHRDHGGSHFLTQHLHGTLVVLHG